MVETTIEPLDKTINELRVSPAQHLHGDFVDAGVSGARGVRVREEQFLTMVGLRVPIGSPDRERLAKVLGTELPARCGEVAVGHDVAVLWLSPDEFLVISQNVAGSTLVSYLRAGASEDGVAVLDLSANRTTLRLEGASARAVLEKGCPLDLHPRAFAPGTAVATSIGRVPVLLWKVENDSYRILPRASYADFLGRWLIDAMAEFKVSGSG
ncbi:sarcosine oxidase subunit gamma [Nocardioides albus]|uniref:Sarcosine oxidase subunit gamma n=1 Tax=Nocardioides albus TaxID=1841 RepID=A0A7W5A2S1_9ACTN|nr:sarcosine oxidase subunit gamma family protein [Nocardioides albus]MBB3088414.1 sarcosine oxidase subunit gamma [Nocardioides albus]GGU16130.1 sarcosine oxidase subunit gamma [Nocardioides albus]